MSTTDKRKVFVIMPFEDTFFEVYEALKREFEDSLIFCNAGDEANQQSILKDIIQPIHDADIILADLTGLNPNVMYELALAHAFNKKTVIITRDQLSSLPFDLKTYRAKQYSTHFREFADLVEYLKRNMTGAIDGTILYSNPVQDFLVTAGGSLPVVGADVAPNDTDADYTSIEPEKGILDFISDIQRNIQGLTKVLGGLSYDMEQMGEEINKSASEVERVKTSEGGNIVNFVRKNTKKAAAAIDVFDHKLRGYNKQIAEIWDEIERDTYGLLKSHFIKDKESRKSVQEYLLSLQDLRTPIKGSNEQIDVLRQSMIESAGIERSLTQAVHFTATDLSAYIDTTEYIAGSIDSILEKGEAIGLLDPGSLD